MSCALGPELCVRLQLVLPPHFLRSARHSQGDETGGSVLMVTRHASSLAETSESRTAGRVQGEGRSFAHEPVPANKRGQDSGYPQLLSWCTSSFLFAADLIPLPHGSQLFLLCW